VRRFGLAGVDYIRPEPRRMARFALAPLGEACFVFLDDTAPWHERLSKVGDALRLLPEDTDLAFVQHSSPSTISWTALDTARPRMPHIREDHIRYNRHLNTRYVPDAHGLQVLTDDHLANAHDLSDWQIEPLGAGRHLVQAADLAPWYATIDPDPDTLAKARHDFGHMILTPETVNANPPPWRGPSD
jgi:hypothetical protein